MVGGVELFGFDAAGRLVEISDANGYVTTVVRDAGDPDVIDYVEEAGGRRLTFTYAGGRIESVTDPLGREVTLGYSGGTLVSYVDVGGGVWSLFYDGSGRLDGFGRPVHHGTSKRWTFHYDSAGRVDWEQDELGRRTTLHYDTPAAGATTVVSPEGRERIDWYNHMGQRWKVTVAPGTDDETSTVTSFGDHFGPLSVVDGAGQRWGYGYDGDGNRSYTVDPTGRESWAEYDPRGLVTATEVNVAAPGSSPVVVRSEYDYDAAGNLVEVLEDIGGTEEATVTYLYGDPAHPGDVTTIVDARGKGWDYTYHPTRGDLQSATDPLGNVTITATNAVGWVTSTVAPRGTAEADLAAYTTTFAHDDYGQVASVTNPAGDVAVNVYGDGGLLVESLSDLGPGDTDPEVTTYDYDDAGALVGVTEASRVGATDTVVSSTVYGYDGDGLRTLWRNGNGDDWTYAYDHAGRLTAETDPNGHVTCYAYTPTGGLESRTDPDGGSACDTTARTPSVSYAYDPAGRLTGIDYTDPATADVVDIGYDGAGRRVTAARAGGTPETWTWDRRGRLTGHSDANGRVTNYGWDEAGNLTSITYPGQATPVTRAFDDAGRLVSVTDWSGRVSGFGYDPDGNWTTTTFPAASGNVDHRTYDPAGRLTGIEWTRGATTLGSFAYTADNESLLATTATAGAATPTPGAYVYDARDQLTAAGADSFAYDPAGNLTERADGTLQVFDPAQQLCWTSPTAGGGGECATPAGDATTYAYDERGNRTGVDRADGSSGEYGYDAENRMTSVVDGGPAPISSMTGGPVVGDFDADGASDVFWYSPGATPEWVSWGTGRDRFGREASSYSVSGTYVPLSGDFNGDGHGDIFWYAPGAGADSVWFWFSDGAGGYTTRFFPVSGTYAPVAGDFDGDGFDDVYWYAPGAGADAVWWGNASVDDSAAFTSTPVTRGGAFEPVAGDFDGNGVDDIFWYEPGPGADTVWFGAGARNSWLARPQTVSGAYDLVAGDFDGDGRDDVVFYSPTAVDTLWWGSDANSFGPASQKPLTLGAGLNPAAGDFDGDGRDDLLLYAPTGADTMWWGISRAGFATVAGLAPDPVDAAYSYDTTGLRHAKSVNGMRSEFTWDRSGGLPLLLAEHHGTQTTYLIHGPGGTPLYQITPTGGPLYLHHDHQGSTRLVTNADGTTTGTLTYSPYGATETNTTGHRLLAGYTGEYTDTETGHTYLRARYMDPDTGQFITRDPLVGETEAPYAYAEGNSVMNRDPSGLICIGRLCSDDVVECLSDVYGCVTNEDDDSSSDTSLGGRVRRGVEHTVRRGVDSVGGSVVKAAEAGYVDARICSFVCIGATYSLDEGFDMHWGMGFAFDASLGIVAGDPSCEPRQEFWASGRNIIGSVSREKYDPGFGPWNSSPGVGIGLPFGFGVVEWFG